MFEIAFRDVQVSGKGVLRARFCYHTHLTAPPSLAAALCWYQQSRELTTAGGQLGCKVQEMLHWAPGCRLGGCFWYGQINNIPIHNDRLYSTAGVTPGLGTGS